MNEKLISASRRKFVLFSPELIHEWIIQGSEMPPNYVKCIAGIPEDAKFISGDYDPLRRAYVAVYEHPSWPEIEIGVGPEFLICEFTVNFER